LPYCHNVRVVAFDELGALDAARTPDAVASRTSADVPATSPNLRARLAATRFRELNMVIS
jgi:hypothetical protein